VILYLAAGCDSLSTTGGGPDGAVKTPATFKGIVEFLDEHGGSTVLEGDEGSRVLVSPALQGRLMTFKVGAVESTGLVNAALIAAGETNPNFNNFGGADRFWLGPEAGQFGLYFAPGVDFTREIWKVPDALDRGPFQVKESSPTKVAMTRDMAVMNYSGTKFKLRVDREIGLIPAASLMDELGAGLPEGVHYIGAYSSNTMTNTGDAAWKEESGLVSIWILGQFNPSNSTVIIAPFRPGDDAELGPAFNDDYFGKVSKEAPERLKTLGNCVLFVGDARREGKFGISQKRTTGLAGAIDFERRLLTIVKFDVPQFPERYANSSWVKNQAEPFTGDTLNSYNAGGKKEGELAPIPFFELESSSPVRPLASGESLRHRHATYHFQGDIQKLNPIARQVLGVELQAVKEAMRK
jgi:hypothetical protein